MKAAKRCWTSQSLGIALQVLIMGLMVVGGQSGNTSPSEVAPDLIVTVGEDYLNRVIRADLEEKVLRE